MVLVSSVHIKLYEVHSIKDKRSIVKSVVAKTRQKFKVSIAETDLHEVWQESMIEFAIISTDKSHAEKQAKKILSFIERHDQVEIIDVFTEMW